MPAQMIVVPFRQIKALTLARINAAVEILRITASSAVLQRQ